MASPAETDRRLKVADYMALDDDQRYELIEGVLAMAAAPNVGHQRVTTSLVALLHNHVEANALGYVFGAPFDAVLFDDTVLQPDILFVRAERWADLYDGHGTTGAPDLVVEVLSPSTSRLDRSVKRDLYLRAGVPWLLLLDPDARVAELFERIEAGRSYRLARTAAANDTLSLTEAVDGFAVNLADLWFDPARFAPDG